MNEHLTDEQLAELRTIADSAAAWFPGQWEHLPGIDWEARVASKEAFIADVGSPVCAEHIAAFDPPTVLALLEAVRERDEYRESLRVTGNALEEVVAELDELHRRLDAVEAMHAPLVVRYGDAPDELACRTCGTHYEYPVAWPCPTVKAARGDA